MYKIFDSEVSLTQAVELIVSHLKSNFPVISQLETLACPQRTLGDIGSLSSDKIHTRFFRSKVTMNHIQDILINHYPKYETSQL